MSKYIRQTFYISGIHCGACEILIRDILSEDKNIVAFELYQNENKVEIIFKDSKLGLTYLEKIFSDTDYKFSLKPTKEKNNLAELGLSFLGAVIIISVFFWLNTAGIIPPLQIDGKSSLWAIFLFGFIASISSCAVLVGGIILTLTQYWQKKEQKLWKPVLSFQSGRIVGFAVFGLALGLLGAVFKLNPIINAILLFVVSVLMILSGLNFLGWKPALKLPKSSLALEMSKNNQTRWFWPALIGLATFFLPCGFTNTAQLLALSSGSPWRAATIMLVFVLGTTPVLSMIALTGNMWQGDKKSQKIVGFTLGWLIIMLGLVNLNSQLAILSLPSINLQKQKTTQIEGLVPQEGEWQIISITADANGYKPNSIKIKAKTKTRLEVKDIGTRGCTNAIIAPAFFSGELPLKNGETVSKEFTSPAAGKYKITCWMGMVTIDVEVVE